MVLKNGQDCFQLWSGNLVFAFIGVSQQAQIFGCGCLKRKCPLRCNISYSGGDIANVGWHIGLGSWYLEYLNYIFWLYCGRRLYLTPCSVTVWGPTLSQHWPCTTRQCLVHGAQRGGSIIRNGSFHGVISNSGCDVANVGQYRLRSSVQLWGPWCVLDLTDLYFIVRGDCGCGCLHIISSSVTLWGPSLG